MLVIFCDQHPKKSNFFNIIEKTMVIIIIIIDFLYIRI